MTQAGADADTLLQTNPPQADAAFAETVAARHWGLRAAARPLSSERDANFHLRAEDGGEFVLKFANPIEPPAITNLQTEALRHIAQRDLGLPVPRVVAGLDGAVERLSALPDGSRCVTRLLTWVPGQPLHAVPSGPALRRDMGRTLGRIARALSDFAHPAADHDLLWDIRRAGRLRGLAPAIADPVLRRRVAGWLDCFDDRIAPQLDGLRRQAVHNDLNPHNATVDPARPTRLAGVLDFGDMVRTAVAADVAVGASYLVAEAAEPLADIGDFVAGYHAAMPLAEDEVALLPELTAMRMVTSIVIASWRAARYPENAGYILRNYVRQREGLDRMEAIPSAEAARRLRRSLDERCA